MTNFLYLNDLPADLELGNSVAIDTETLGLDLKRDRLCVVQISNGDGNAHLVQFEADNDYSAPNLKKLLADDSVEKLMHFGRFDIAQMKQNLGVLTKNVYCTRTASKIARTYTDNHGLKVLCEELLGQDMSKKQQSSYWGREELDKKQLEYAAGDVLYLHKIKDILDEMLKREGRYELAMETMKFLPTRAVLDLEGWPDDIFAH